MKNIQENLPQFSFRPVNSSQVSKIISNLNIKKATGVDNISAKILKSCGPAISHTVSCLINETFKASKFPHSLKVGQVSPLHKKKDPLNKQNFRRVCILNTTSKIYERAKHIQLAEYFEAVFNPFLPAFRKGSGFQTTLLRLLEDWKRTLDNHEYVAAVLHGFVQGFRMSATRSAESKIKTIWPVCWGSRSIGQLPQQRVKLGPSTTF